MQQLFWPMANQGLGGHGVLKCRLLNSREIVSLHGERGGGNVPCHHEWSYIYHHQVDFYALRLTGRDRGYTGEGGGLGSASQ